jgi:hypothetical protein
VESCSESCFWRSDWDGDVVALATLWFWYLEDLEDRNRNLEDLVVSFSAVACGGWALCAYTA